MADMNLIKQLREATFAPLGDCKSALDEANGDIERAKQILKEKGIAKAWKKADRETNEWMIQIVTENGKTVVLKLLCETDFVVKNDHFQTLFVNILDLLKKQDGEIEGYDNLPADTQAAITDLLTSFVGTIGENVKIGDVLVTSEHVYGYNHPGNKVASLIYYTGDEAIAKKLALQVAAMDPTYLTFDEVPQAEKDAATARFTEELKAQGKPEAMIPQIVAGKLNKEFADDVLMEQESIHDNTKKVKDMVSGDFQISKFKRFAI